MPTQRYVFRSFCTATLLAGALLASDAANAQTVTNSGFTVNRYEPTAAGEWSFWVDHPWYSSTRYFAAGITLNYAHNPLIFGRVSADGTFTQTTSVIEHQLLGHVDLAGSFLDRVLITGTLPVTFLERGTMAAGVSPTSGVVVGDPRFGLWVRLFGQPYRGPIAMSIGANVWVPLRAFEGTGGVSPTSSDQGVRLLPKVVLGGLASRVMWSFTAGFLYRPAARIGVGVDDAGSTVGSELQLGAAIAYADTVRRFAIGPEAIMSTVVMGTDAVKPFTREFTSLEVLLGFHYNIAKLINIGAAGGLGVLRTPGTPDARALFRLAYAPIRDLAPKDRDKDGIPDVKDACPDTPGVETDEPNTNGCPDRDRDGIVDKIDLCPDTHKGPRPDPNRLGCPIGDRDSDEVLDPEDLCPDTPKGPRPDPNRLGCPMGDRDSDGVLDADDQCPEIPKGDKPDPSRLGCPAGDRDGDAVVDFEDQCPDLHKGPKPDPGRLGCPYGDRDKDTVIDPEDACPDTPGAPHPDPKKNGCPGLVMVQDGQIKILQPVFFATNKDVILQKSFPVLQSVADALKVTTNIKKVAIEGHTDDRGKADYNRTLSDRRAQSVLKWLTTTGGIEASRLEAKGYGPDRPIADNKTPKGREKNRRVDFVILDPPQAKNVQTANPKDVVVPVSPDQSDKTAGKKGGKPGPAPKGPAAKGPAAKGPAAKGPAAKKPAPKKPAPAKK